MYWFSELKRQLGLSYYYNIGGIIFLWSDLFQARKTGQWNMSLNYNILFNVSISFVLCKCFKLLGPKRLFSE